MAGAVALVAEPARASGLARVRLVVAREREMADSEPARLAPDAARSARARRRGRDGSARAHRGSRRLRGTRAWRRPPSPMRSRSRTETSRIESASVRKKISSRASSVASPTETRARGTSATFGTWAMPAQRAASTPGRQDGAGARGRSSGRDPAAGERADLVLERRIACELLERRSRRRSRSGAGRAPGPSRR